MTPEMSGMSNSGSSDSRAASNRLNDNQTSGLLYFYIHFVTEVVCFYTLARYVGDNPTIWLVFLSYDMLAFVPQSIIGYFSDKHPRVPLGAIGLVLLGIALLIMENVKNPYASLFILCLGNCFVHVNGAETTLRTAKGKVSGIAIFVSGGSFGVVTGKLMGGAGTSSWPLLILLASALPLAIFAQRYISEAELPFKKQCLDFKYAKPGLSVGLVIAAAVTVVAVRGFMGYGIPTSWNKTAVQTVMLFSFMGVGKALGGILADRFGFKRTALVSAALAAPFLMFGDHLMVISLFGVMMFSMTMAITLGILVSVLPETPGLAFGWTTIGLFLGTAPVFFFKFTTITANCIMIAVLTILCLILLWFIIREDGADG